jgi:hypothetical protein
MAKTKEEISNEVDAEIEALKTVNGGDGLFNQSVDGKTGEQKRTELTEADYEQKKIDITEDRWNDQQFGYIQARREAYPEIVDFVEAYTEKEIGEDDTKWTAYVEKYNQARSDHPKPE